MSSLLPTTALAPTMHVIYHICGIHASSLLGTSQQHIRWQATITPIALLPVSGRLSLQPVAVEWYVTSPTSQHRDGTGYICCTASKPLFDMPAVRF
jgi:hypothetical protein